MNNGSRVFTYLEYKNLDEELNIFLDECLGGYDLDDSKQSDGVDGGIDARKLIKKIAKSLQFDFSIITEFYHVDKNFRDAYYMYFASQHFQVDRYCKRITFLKGKYDWKRLLYNDPNDIKNIEEDVIGTCVVVPVSTGILGKSLLNPKYFFSEEGSFIRKSSYTFHLYGLPLTIDAFPYQMQDRETMRCSEVTLLNLMDYYSNTYKEYKAVLPSEIIRSEQKYNHERSLPSRGITYHMLTKVLSDVGFSPRLYNLRAMKNDGMSNISQKDELRRLLHYYIESGIPVAVNVEPKSGGGVGHSLLCIGHSSRKEHARVNENKMVIGDPLNPDFQESESFGIIDSADYYDRYVVIDDNQFPYTVSDFDNLSIYDDMQVTNIAVPLYKRMFMEAADAHWIAHEILISKKWGIFTWARDYLKDNNIKDVVLRLYLASSRSYKSERVKAFSGSDKELQMVYGMVRLPQFVWVCELYSVEGYNKANPEAFAEIVLDGTSANKKGIRNIIMLNYPNGIYCRNPEESEINDEVLLRRLDQKNHNRLIPSYRKNLTFYGNCDT